MLIKNNDVQLFVNGQIVDLSEDFDLSLNNKIFDPETILTKTVDYSYSFDIPITERNCKIFDYANILSVVSKFVKTYDTELNVDGISVFSGKLRISEVSNGNFKCNLIIVKLNTVEDIFGDDTLNMVNWKIPFDGIPTINSVNMDETSKYYFPLVSYGAFAKKPKNKYNTYNDYSSIYDIDETNKFYYSTFYPSLNVMETIRKCFEYKGYQVDGSAFSDSTLNNLYMSTNLASDQQPIYNLGNPKFGKCSLNIQFDNYYAHRNPREETTTYPVATGTLIDLKFPYNQYEKNNGYDFDEIYSYNILETTKSRVGENPRNVYTWHSNVNVLDETYMFSEDDGAITIPADGLYKITLNVSNIETIYNRDDMHNSKSMKVKQHHTRNQWLDGVVYDDEITIGQPRQKTSTGNYTDGWNYREWKPIEIQLVKNYENDLELIKGTTSWFHNGNTPTKSGTLIKTAYPHSETRRANASDMTDFSIYPTKKMDYSNPDKADAYYMPNESEMFMYDQTVNPNFICGFSTMGKCPAFMKNGYSWYLGDTTSNDVRTNCDGYFRYSNEDGSVVRTDYHKMNYPDSPDNYINLDTFEAKANGFISGIVYLHKNDRLTLHIVTRAYETEIETDRSSRWTTSTYPVSANCTFSIEAMSKDHTEIYFNKGNNYNSPTEWDEDLNLGNFLNKDTKMSEFINDVINSFNLSYQQDGNHISIDTQKNSVSNNSRYAVRLDDRINTSATDFSISRIEYPSSLSVKYNINTSESGFYESVPKKYINDDDWEKYGYYGYEVIEMDNSGDAKAEEISLKNSYCWYHKFNFIQDDVLTEMNIPVIAESQYMIDRGNIEEYMTKDGYSLSTRFWFRDLNMSGFVPTVYGDSVNLYIPISNYNGLELNYNSNENNILNKYFNIVKDTTSNYIEVECYLNCVEYTSIKNGANVVVDSDLYKVCDIQKYSITQRSKCKLKLMKI